MGRQRHSLNFAFTIVIALITLTASLQHVLTGALHAEGVPDTGVREALLQKKKVKEMAGGIISSRSVRYPSIIHDVEIREPYRSKLPWAQLVPKDPYGRYSFNWRIRLGYDAVLSVNPTAGAAKEFSFKVSDAEGSPVYLKTASMTLPGEEAALKAGLYVLQVSSSVPLDTFEVSLKPLKGTYPPARPEAEPRLRTVRLRFDEHHEADFKRLVKMAEGSTTTSIVNMPGGSARGEIVDESGRLIARVKIGLSGRTREHLKWFPSADIRTSGGRSFEGLTSFKLYRVETKSGLLDLAFLSVLEDMGYMTSRMDLVRLLVNREDAGLYILQETPSPAFFPNQAAPEGNIVGTDIKKLFYDYPYGALLDARYFHKLKDMEAARLDGGNLFSEDFAGRLDDVSFPAYIAFASVYYAGHGLGIDDLRFYEDPASGRFYPIPRDLNPGDWNLKDEAASFLTHASWALNEPFMTVWPVRRLLPHDYRFERDKDPGEGVDKDESATGLTDAHFALAAFLKKPENLSLTNRYLLYFMENEAIKRALRARALHALKAAVKEHGGNATLRKQLMEVDKDGFPSFSGPDMDTMTFPERGLYVKDGNAVFYWNLRTARTLKPGLLPSFTAPLSAGLTEDVLKETLALSFLLEKRVFSILEASGVKMAARTFETASSLETDGKGGAGLEIDATLSANQVRTNPARPEKKENRSVDDTATYLGTRIIDDEDALILFLVRNASEKASGYSILTRDAFKSYAPLINKTFTIAGEGREGTDKATLSKILRNYFLKGERLRLLAFKLPLGGSPIFYSLKVPEGGHIIFPPYMYLPARAQGGAGGAGGAGAKGGVGSEMTKMGSTAKNREGLPEEVREDALGFHIPAGSVVRLKGDLVFPDGKALYIHEGVRIILPERGSVNISGDLHITGTKERPVIFEPRGDAPWGGLYAGGHKWRKIRVDMKNAVFKNYGSFPRTKVAGLSLNGGITFQNAEVSMEAVKISGSKGEDALNLISSTVYMKDTEITGSASDSIDFDFTDGLLEGLKIKGSAGDSLDLSNSLVVVRGSSFEGSKDKGISIGEMSRVLARDSEFLNNGTGIANKDQSSLTGRGLRFTGNKTAIAEFIKKPYFGKPSSDIKESRYEGNDYNYRWLGFFNY